MKLQLKTLGGLAPHQENKLRREGVERQSLPVALRAGEDLLVHHPPKNQGSDDHPV